MGSRSRVLRGSFGRGCDRLPTDVPAEGRGTRRLFTDFHLPSAEDGSRGALIPQHLQPALLSGRVAVSRCLGLMSQTRAADNSRNVFSHGFVGWKSEIEVSAGPRALLACSWLPWCPLALGTPGLRRRGVCVSPCSHGLPLRTAGVGLTAYSDLVQPHLN